MRRETPRLLAPLQQRSFDMLRKFIVLLYKIKTLFSFGKNKRDKNLDKNKELEVPNERYTLW